MFKTIGFVNGIFPFLQKLLLVQKKWPFTYFLETVLDFLFYVKYFLPNFNQNYNTRKY